MVTAKSSWEEVAIDPVPLFKACDLLAARLVDRNIPLDLGAAELKAISFACSRGPLSGTRILIIQGGHSEPRHVEALTSLPRASLARLSAARPGECLVFDSQISGQWADLLSIVGGASGVPTLLLAVALSDEEVKALGSESFSRPDLAVTTLLGETLQEDMEGSVFARSWAVWPRNAGDVLPDDISVAFRRSLGLPRALEVKSVDSHVAQVDIISLRTAAAATSGLFGRDPKEDLVFDMHARAYKAGARHLEFAVLKRATVIPSASWKVIVDDRLYIEEIGYVERGRPNLIENWPEFGAFWSVRLDGPSFKVPLGGFTFLLGGDVAHYHLLLNWLPRLRILDDPRVVELTGDVPRIAVSSRFSLKETGLVCRLVGRSVDFVPLPEAGTYMFPNLIVPSFFSHHELTPAVADWYRSKLRIGNVELPRRIYISRADSRELGTPRRKVVNEAEVIGCLSSHGFESVELGGMSIDDQIQLFRQVSFVIGPHGAGFANMVFAPAGARALVLENSWAHNFIADMLNVAGHHASIVICQDSFSEEYEAELRAIGYPDTEVQRSRDMTVDCVKLDRIVRELLSEA